MALTYIFITAPNGFARAMSGKTYSANSAGIITGVPGSDAITLNATLLMGTGATADRPTPTSAASSFSPVGGPNSLYPAPTIGQAFYDTTLSKACWYVGTGSSASGWVDQNGASV
jgi:hypothetical protein